MKGCRIDGADAVEIRFPAIHFLSISDEGSRLRLLNDLGDVRATILKTRGDPVVSQFLAESLGTLESLPLAHYLVLLGEEIFDVISGYAPEVIVAGA
jgi:hypothetical protein